jgi:hypothetical protein
MRRKPDSCSGARTDPGTRRRQNVVGLIRQAGVQPRRRRKCERGRPIRPGAVALAGPDVVDDFPQAIPVVQRELDVIETYLGALLDDARWDGRNSPKIALGENPPRCENDCRPCKVRP